MSNKRIESIDLVRGLAMVLMALDHVRDYFHITANTDDPLNLDTTTPALFLTRWITHFCAPIFVFLSGTSIFLQGERKTNNELSSFLLKRGMWLIFAEWFIVSLAWTFNPLYNVVPFQVIWAIGISMVIMGLFIRWRTPKSVLLLVGIVLVAGHNLLDIAESSAGFVANFWWDFFHHGFFKPYEIIPGHNAFLVYAFPPWLGVMMLGYCAGQLYSAKFSPTLRKIRLRQIGFGLILLFIVFRIWNLYGDPQPWKVQSNVLYSFFSFINTDKYPASLLYLCMTIGPALLLLSSLENIKNRITSAFVVFGRTAFFYYILHLYLIHFLATISFFLRGHQLSEITNTENIFPFLFVVPGEGFGLPTVYAVWITIVFALYPLCRWYNDYKSWNKHKWWLSYL